ncbi:hypothetical protein SAMN04488005_3058 [Yoonia tamlensis]|uniref:Uncharacterized protein n=1 Tax=Yoonia tamlensis TaxID=390270 RepID=A0A1I6HWE8_9RHOB|nr:hypothetical protein [Yoonia tamlensis]SFR58786.1 hypothetical protein SAMN04488005_3058 [Yoonia tamlensis]
MIAQDAFAPARTHEKVIWVFAIEMPAQACDAFKSNPAALTAALGIAQIDEAHIEIFDVETIRDYGFAKYLTEAHGMNPAQITPEATMLAAIKGHVLLVFSDALDGQVLAPSPPLRFIGRYGAAPAVSPVDKINTDAAKGILPQPKPAKSDARMSGMVATAALVVMFLIVGLMIWIAG